MKAGVRGDCVAHAVEVKRSSDKNAGDTVEAGHVPCQLWLVDADMRGERALLALGDEERVSFGFGGLRGRGRGAVS